MSAESRHPLPLSRLVLYLCPFHFDNFPLAAALCLLVDKTDELVVDVHLLGLYTRSADFSLFPSKPAHFFGFWVKSGSDTVRQHPRQQRLVVHRAGGDSKTDLDDLIISAVQPNTVDLQSGIDLY